MSRTFDDAVMRRQGRVHKYELLRWYKPLLAYLALCGVAVKGAIPTGSAYFCDVGNDADYVVHVESLGNALQSLGGVWEMCGALYGDQLTLRKGDINLIIVQEETQYRSWCTGFEVCMAMLENRGDLRERNLRVYVHSAIRGDYDVVNAANQRVACAVDAAAIQFEAYR